MPADCNAVTAAGIHGCIYVRPPLTRCTSFFSVEEDMEATCGIRQERKNQHFDSSSSYKCTRARCTAISSTDEQTCTGCSQSTPP
jgi:hypothetical protein